MTFSDRTTVRGSRDLLATGRECQGERRPLAVLLIPSVSGCGKATVTVAERARIRCQTIEHRRLQRGKIAA
jgi:hypothetical protein